MTANQAGYTASITAQAGCTYAWSITGGALSSPTTGTSVTFTAGPSGSVLLSCTVTNAAGTPSSTGSTSCAVVAPATQPTVTAPGNVTAGQTGYTASITAQAGCTYAWTITGGVLTSSTTGTNVTFTAGASGQVHLSCTVTDAGSTSAPAGTATCTIVAVPTQPTLTFPAVVTASHTGLIASVPVQPGCTYAWGITGGAITSVTTGTSVTFAAGNSGSVQLSCTVTNAANTAAPAGTATCSIVPALSPVVTAPATVTAGQIGCVASVTPLTAAAYAWSITGGSFTSGSTGTSATFTAGASGSVQLSCSLTNAAGDAYSASATSSVVLGIAGNASTFPRANRTLTPSGGSGTGYTWSLLTNNSGGSIVAGTGVYTAGSTGGVTDTVQLTDSLSSTTTATIAVSAGVSITPSTLSLAPRATQSLTASGGSGTGYTWSMATNNSGGNVNASSGLYTAGTTGHVSDLVQVLDSLGNSATLSVSVTAGFATHFTVAGFPSPTTSGVAHSVTITALDQDNNTANGYLGTVHITSSDPLVVAPADYAFQASDNGVHTLNVTLRTAGSQSITATDTVSGTITGAQAGITVQAAGAASLALTSFPDPTTTNVAHSVTVRALDPAGNTATGYLGTVHLTSTDLQAILPSDYTFLPGDAGVHALSVTLKTLGTQSITATDTVPSSITGSQTGIVVNDVAPSSLTYTYTATTFATNIVAATDTPSSSGGPVVSYAVAPALPTGLTMSTSTGIINGTPTADTPLATYTVTATNSGGSTTVGLAFKVMTAVGTWTSTGSMGFPRSDHTATLLPNHQVLILGRVNSSAIRDAELFDPSLGSFASAGLMAVTRDVPVATLVTVIGNPNVLIVGGGGTSAELYAPNLVAFTGTGAAGSARRYQTSTRLPDGTVLITGGFDGTSFLASAEIYDPVGGTFSPTGPMSGPRQHHTATLLANGKVLIAGGDDGVADLGTAELFDPALGTFSTPISMSGARAGGSATLLADGTVLLAGGLRGATYLATAEVYDPAAGVNGSFSATLGDMALARKFHAATLLGGGKVLLAGGSNTGGILAGCELYNPTTKTFEPAGSLNVGRSAFTTTLLFNGKVLAAGGLGTSGYLSSAELYQ